VTVYAGAEDLRAGLAEILESPKGEGIVELVARRPAEGEREILEEGVLDPEHGLVGDRWTDKPRHPDTQVTLMNARAIGLMAGDDRERWALAGDQLYVDLDLSIENLPPGTRLEVGSALLEVTKPPHTGCAKFTERFGSEAIKFVNKSPGRELRLRGMYARVVEAGTVRPGNSIRKL
jgi:MOSC domain-containing protein YiiM